MNPGTLLQEAGWALEPVQKVVENLALTGVRTPNCPAYSQSLYPLHYHTRRSCGVKTLFANSDGSLLCLQPSGTPLHRLILVLKHLLSFITPFPHRIVIVYHAIPHRTICYRLSRHFLIELLSFITLFLIELSVTVYQAIPS